MNERPLMPLIGQHPFHIEVSDGSASLVADNNQIRLNLSELEPAQLLELKNLAHNQYVRAMLFDDVEMNVHRATLNLLCRMLERKGNPVSLVAKDRARTRSNRPTSTPRPARAA